MFESKERVFNYNSVFKYSKVSTEDNLWDDSSSDPNEVKSSSAEESHPYPLINFVVHKSIVGLFYILFIISFPISALFCVQRIHSLQRCLVYRLGIRQPLKGPGLIIRFPFIDCIEIIDLSDNELDLIDTKQQYLTSDGSIIEFISIKCCLNITNAIRSSTQLKDSKFNVQQFCRLSFVNMIAATHVEDFENKMNIIVEQFEQNSNQCLNDWGYNCKFKQLPKFVVINRANPISPIVSKLKNMFGGQQTNESNPMFNELKKFQSNSTQIELTDNQIVDSLQKMSEKYRNYVFHDIFIRIQVQESDSNDYFTYSHTTGKVTKLSEKSNKVDINISADSRVDLTRFCCDNDINSVRITTNLI